MRTILLLGLLGCASPGPNLDQTAVGSLDFGTPSGWVKKDFSNPERQMMQWVPEDNENKESIVVIRANRPTSVNEDLGRLLAKAQQPHSIFLKPIKFETKNGVRGSKIEGTITANATTYHRLHAVFVDGTNLVNVLYTAKNLDRENFDAVIDSFRKKI